jgi:hypothetical protein
VRSCMALAEDLIPSGAEDAMPDRTGSVEAERSCLVCDWRGTIQESDDTAELGGECPACHAPTERLSVRRRWDHSPNPHAVALGRLGGLRGGPARAGALSPRRRREIARAAALARWSR